MLIEQETDGVCQYLYFREISEPSLQARPGHVESIFLLVVDYAGEVEEEVSALEVGLEETEGLYLEETVEVF
jgi:hypothetical protein